MNADAHTHTDAYLILLYEYQSDIVLLAFVFKLILYSKSYINIYIYFILSMWKVFQFNSASVRVFCLVLQHKPQEFWAIGKAGDWTNLQDFQFIHQLFVSFHACTIVNLYLISHTEIAGTALRKTMVRAHRQAWAWQDEWYGLTMDDIREIERQTQLALQKKMGLNDDDDEDGNLFRDRFHKYMSVANLPTSILFFFLPEAVERSASEVDTSKHSSQFQSIEKTEETPMFPKKLPPPQLKEHPPSVDSSEGEDEAIEVRPNPRKERSESGQMSYHSKFGSKGALHSPIGSMHSFDLQVCMFFIAQI